MVGSLSGGGGVGAEPLRKNPIFYDLKKIPEPQKNCITCLVLVNIDQQKKVMKHFCEVSDNTIYSNFNLTEWFETTKV